MDLALTRDCASSVAEPASDRAAGTRPRVDLSDEKVSFSN
jgi:hypothetical protein